MMQTSVTVYFSNPDEAENAFKKIQKDIPFCRYSIESTKKKKMNTRNYLAPIYPLTDADRAEQTHGNLLPIFKEETTHFGGEVRLKLALNASHAKWAESRLVNLHGYGIKKEIRD